MKNFILALLLGSAFFACVGDISNTLKVDQVGLMLHADTIKIWSRTFRSVDGVMQNLDDISESQSLLFINSSNYSDTTIFGKNSLIVGGEVIVTDSSLSITPLTDTLSFQAQGNIDQTFLDRIYLLRADTISDSLNVIDITTRYLRITFKEQEAEIEEIYQIETQ